MAIPENIRMGLDRFIAQVIIGSAQYDRRLCFILGSGASISSGIPAGGEMEMGWMDFIMKQSPGYIEDARLLSEDLRRAKAIDHDFGEIEQAWKEAKENGKKTLPSDYYFDIFVLRFHGTYDGVKELQNQMRGREPSVGYYILSLLLTANDCRNNVVITTNFDSLLEKAVFAYTQQAPVVVTHESLVESMRWNVPYPIIAKVHRDLMFSPLNSTKDINTLKKQWKTHLKKLLEDYTPIVIGYAGADKSLMSFLENDSTYFPNGLYWCYWEKGGDPHKRIINLMKKKRGFLVPIEGFDELMLRSIPASYPIINDSGEEHHNYINSANRALRELKDRYNLNIKKYKNELNRIAKKIESETPSTSWGFFNRACRYIEKGNYQEAIADLSSAIELKPDFALSYNNRGTAYGKSGNHEAAIADFSKAIKLQPDYAEAYYNRGTAYGKSGNHEAAIADFSKAIELKPDFAGAYNNRGAAFDSSDNYQAAIADYNKAIELDPDYVSAYYNRGNAYSNAGNHQNSIEDYTKAIELKPDFAEAYNNRGSAYGKSGNHETAIADYNKAIELNPDYAIAYHNRGEAYEKLGNQQAAEADFKKALELDLKLKIVDGQPT